MVGGAVRDLLLGESPKDFDVATDATPEQTEKLFRRCRLIGRRFVIVHVRFGDETIEVTTFRGQGEGADGTTREIETSGRILRDNVFGSIEEDAVRRDFTVNALYYNIADFSVIDFVGGLEDLERKQLRLIGEPATRYREDPVRMLRAARLKAKLGFTLAPGTHAPIGALRGELREIPPARLFEEVLKLFLTGHAVRSLAELRALDLFGVLFPALEKLLRRDPSGLALINASLANTDERFAADKPVAAGFLIAALGWPLLDRVQLDHSDPDVAHAAADAALGKLGEVVALPRRYTLQAREIWELQGRMLRATAGRARRLLALPRLRAGYDFLLLRAVTEPALEVMAQRWTMALQPDANLDQLFARSATAAAAAGSGVAGGVAPEDVAAAFGESERKPAKKRRRRRRRKPGDGGGGETGGAEGRGGDAPGPDAPG